MSAEILRARAITKNFHGVKALDDAQLTLRSGEIHALMGENGAGKSTLIKVLTGVHTPDAGNVELEETPSFALATRKRRPPASAPL